MWSTTSIIAIALIVINPVLWIVLIYKTSVLFNASRSTNVDNSEICLRVSCKPATKCCNATIKTIDESLYCCHNDIGERFHSIAKTVLKTNYERDYKHDCYLQRMRKCAEVVNKDKTKQKPAAHVYTNQDVVYDKKNSISAIQWTSNGTRSFTRSGVSIVQAGIKVVNSGSYFVYSSVMYYGNGTHPLDYYTLCHCLYKKGKSDTIQLASNSLSMRRIQRGKPCYETSYIGAVYYLEAGSTIKVTTSLVDNVVRDPQMTYFGLYMI